MVNSGKELPQGTHADRFDENRVYSITSYSKGIVPNPIDVFDRKRECNEDVEKKYYSDFKFKHPTPNDIKRSAKNL
jgi:hypothetical protein